MSSSKDIREARRHLAIIFTACFALWAIPAAANVQINLSAQGVGWVTSSGTMSPALVSNYSTGIDYATLNGTGDTGSIFYINLKLPFRGGNNCAVMGLTYNSGFTLSTVTDNESETWHAGPVDTSGGFDVASYYVLGDTSGTSQIEVETTGSTVYPSYFGAVVTEVENCNTSAIGGSGHNHAGSGAPTVTLSAAPASGDMTWDYCQDTYVGAANPHKITTIAAGSGFSLLSAALSFGKAAQSSTTSTSTSVSFTTFSGTSGTTSCVALVIRQGSAGTGPPATKYIDHYQVESIAASYALDFPCSGNGIVGLMTTGTTTHITSSITGSTGTWEAPAGLLETSGNIAQIVYGYGASCAATTTITPAWSATPGAGTQLEFASISNANNTSSFYDSAGSGTSTGTQTTGANLTTTTTTPSATGEFTFNVTAINRHTETSMVADSNSHTPTPLFAVNSTNDDSGDCSNSTEASTLDEDNGYAFYVNTSDTLALTFIYDGTQVACGGDGVGGWGSVNGAFK